MRTSLTREQLRRALALRDLTDPAAGPHAMQLVVDAVLGRLTAAWGCELLVHRGSPVVSVAENYELLGYPEDAPAREARYTRYVGGGRMLRSHTTAMVPAALRRLAARRSTVVDVLVACPGLVYRRDVVDRLHVGEPHQLDLWRVARRRLGAADLDDMVALVVEAVLPGAAYRAQPARHPYTLDGREVEVAVDGRWVELLECGLAAPHVLAAGGVDPEAHSGLALGVGLDRALMLRKGIPDIRLLRATDARVAGQLRDLAPYRAVSSMPPVRRDLSIAAAPEVDAEALGDRVRELPAESVEAIEELAIVSDTPRNRLPPAAVARLGMRPGQRNLLVRLVLRHPTRTLTDAEANRIRNLVYAAIHEGDVHQWAS